MKTVIEMPLFIVLPRKTKADKKYIINLNNYRNWHYIVSNQVKKAYSKLVSQRLQCVSMPTPINVSYQLYKGSNRLCDRANVYSIHEKFFMDALVSHGCIPDDNDNYLNDAIHRQTLLDRKNPRMEITIEH